MTCHEVTIQGPSNTDEGNTETYGVMIVPPVPGEYIYTYAWTAPGATVLQPNAATTQVLFDNAGQVSVTVLVSLALSAYPSGLPVSPPRTFTAASVSIERINMQDGQTFGITNYVSAENAAVEYSHPLITMAQAEQLSEYYDSIYGQGQPAIIPDDVWIGLDSDMLAIERGDGTGRSWWFAAPLEWDRSKNPNLVTVTVRLVGRTLAQLAPVEIPLLGVTIQGPGHLRAAGTAAYSALVAGPTETITYTYVWQAFGASIDTATAASCNITFPGPGVYLVEVTATGGGDSVASEIEVSVQS